MLGVITVLVAVWELTYFIIPCHSYYYASSGKHLFESRVANRLGVWCQVVVPSTLWHSSHQ
eukprot:scaffold134043_cov57-Attheya_sp.AAC.1